MKGLIFLKVRIKICTPPFILLLLLQTRQTHHDLFSLQLELGGMTKILYHGIFQNYEAFTV